MPAAKRISHSRITTSETVSVTVVEPHLVYHDGEQRSGVLNGVTAKRAGHWVKHGWVKINEPQPERDPTPAPQQD